MGKGSEVTEDKLSSVHRGAGDHFVSITLFSKETNGNIMCYLFLEIFFCRVAPDTDLTEYPANIFAGYPVSGRISG